jgi:hypothetical protein
MRAWVVKGNKNTRTRFADDEWKLSIHYTKKRQFHLKQREGGRVE